MTKTSVHTVSDVEAGLRLEDALMASHQPGSLCWSSEKPALVCPAPFQRKAQFERARAISREAGWPIATRSTGGGVVPQRPGTLNVAVSLTVPPEFSIEDGYRLITCPIQDTLAMHDLVAEAGATPGSFCDGAWNLSVAGRKIVGTAQRWRPLPNGQRRILVHAAILCHGRVGPGADAVNAFLRALGEPATVRAAAHTTLETALGRTRAEIAPLTTAIMAALGQHLVRLDRQWNRVAA